MTSIKIDDLIEMINKNGIKAKDGFSVSFVDEDEHQKRYEETRELKISNGKILNIDFDEHEEILSIEVVNYK